MIFSPRYEELKTEVDRLSPNKTTFVKVQNTLLLTSLLLRASRSGEPTSLNYEEFNNVSILCFIINFAIY